MQEESKTEQQPSKEAVKLQGTVYPTYDAFYASYRKSGYPKGIKIYGVNLVVNPSPTHPGKYYYSLEPSFSGDEESGYQGNPNAFVYATAYAIDKYRANLNIYGPTDEIQFKTLRLDHASIEQYRLMPSDNTFVPRNQVIVKE